MLSLIAKFLFKDLFKFDTGFFDIRSFSEIFDPSINIFVLTVIIFNNVKHNYIEIDCQISISWMIFTGQKFSLAS